MGGVSLPPSRSKEVLYHLHERHWQLVRVAQNGVARLAENATQVFLALTVDREAERVDALSARLDDRLARVLDAVQAFIPIHIVRLPVGEDEEQTMRGGLTLEECRRMADRRPG